MEVMLLQVESREMDLEKLVGIEDRHINRTIVGSQKPAVCWGLGEVVGYTG